MYIFIETNWSKDKWDLGKGTRKHVNQQISMRNAYSYNRVEQILRRTNI